MSGRLRHRVGAGLAAVALALLTAASGHPAPAGAADLDPHLTESRLTKAGTGRFADLSVTVGKTRNLGNEAIQVTWKWAGDPASHGTVDATRWKYNYLQIFQCWGDDSSGPKREQCQFGGFFNSSSPYKQVSPFDQASAEKVLSRVVSEGGVGGIVERNRDPLEYTDPHGYPAIIPPAGGLPRSGVVDLRSSNGSPALKLDPASADTSTYFDQFGTNEVPVARTTARGTGQVFFEAQTLYQSRFLGCGERLRGGAARSCWLVVVPRDAHEVTGVDLTGEPGTNWLSSSPLALTNWANRIVFPLAFDPVREACAIGGVERPIIGHESLGEAVRSWQGPLCASGQGYFYSGTTDELARQAAADPLPKLSVVTDPLPADAIPAGQGAAAYAPVGVSGLTIAFFIERQYSPAVASPAALRNTGTRVEGLRLNQRLVAKLLTESYRQATITRPWPAHLDKNPDSLVDDPEFRQLNQQLVGELAVSDINNVRRDLARLLYPQDGSDAIRLLWAWVLADPDAAGFIEGKPDRWGMVVNKFYTRHDSAGRDRYYPDGALLDNLPKLEQSCEEVVLGSNSTARTTLCADTAAPYTSSLEQGAVLAGRGQPVGTESAYIDPNTGLLRFERPQPQVIGQRAIIALTDTPSATLRGLVSAALPNRDGRFVTPTVDAMSAAVAQAGPGSVPGVRRIDPTQVGAAGYPLTRISYAVTNPAKLDVKAREAYSSFIDVVTTRGQQPGSRPGDLPHGYAPLTRELVADAALAADAIRRGLAPTIAEPVSPPTPEPTPPPTQPDAGGEGSGGGDWSPDDSTVDSYVMGPVTDGPALGSVPEVVPPAGVTAAQDPAPAGVQPPSAIASIVRRTPFTAAGGWLVPAAAVAGAGLLLTSRLLLADFPRRRRRPT